MNTCCQRIGTSRPDSWSSCSCWCPHRSCRHNRSLRHTWEHRHVIKPLNAIKAWNGINWIICHYIQFGSAQTLVETHLKAYGGQVTFRGHGSGCSSSDATPNRQLGGNHENHCVKAVTDRLPSLQSMVPSHTSSMARQALLLAHANVSSGQGG